MITASTPGKLMLAGEYVVAERQIPALSVAVSKRLKVELELSSEPGWVVSSDALNLTRVPPEQIPVVAHALAQTQNLPVGGHLRILSELGAGPGKPGLGGSAALAVAALGALSKAAGNSKPSVELCIEVHRASQAGRGSGYDVATAHQGGLIAYTPGFFPGMSPRVEQIKWPEGLYAAVFTTGRSASTTELLGRVQAWREEDLESFEACIEPLAQETLVFIDAFKRHHISQILDAAAQVQEELATMDRIGQIGILGGGQHQLLGLIEDYGAIARTSGAGGGDCAWALTDDPDRLIALQAAITARGFHHLELTLGEQGLVVDGGDEA